MSDFVKPLVVGLLLIYAVYVSYGWYTSITVISDMETCQDNTLAAIKNHQIDSKALEAAITDCSARAKAAKALVPIVN